MPCIPVQVGIKRPTELVDPHTLQPPHHMSYPGRVNEAMLALSRKLVNRLGKPVGSNCALKGRIHMHSWIWLLGSMLFSSSSFGPKIAT